MADKKKAPDRLHTTLYGYADKEEAMPKRVGHLYEYLLDKAFIRETVIKACYGRHKRRDVSKVISDVDAITERLYAILSDEERYIPACYQEKVIFDESSQKHRCIRTVPFNPDCLIQWLVVEVLKAKVFMRGMDYWCSASIPGRGGQHVYKGITRFIKRHHHEAKYCLQADVHHYYDSINITKLMDKLRRRIKDERFLCLVEKILRASSADGKTGIGIGYHLNQWMANFFLEDIDRAIRRDGSAKFYVRYMDNMTIIGSNKRKLRKLRKKLQAELREVGLELKGDWQIFPLSARSIAAVGYRYSANGIVRMRKRNWLKLRRQILRITEKQKTGKLMPPKQARAFLSRFGSMKKFAPSRRIFQMAHYIDFADLRRIAV